MRNITALVAAVCLSLLSCATNTAARDASHNNARRIRSVQLGQSMIQVLAIMETEPEIRTVRLASEGREEEWGWVTDYENDMMTLIRFRGNKAVEISQQAWSGAWSKDTIRDDEDLRTEEENAFRIQAAEQIQRNRSTIETVIQPGMSRSQILGLVGSPDNLRVTKSGGRGQLLFQVWTYATPAGTFTVEIEADSVRRVVAVKP